MTITLAQPDLSNSLKPVTEQTSVERTASASGMQSPNVRSSLKKGADDRILPSPATEAVAGTKQKAPWGVKWRSSSWYITTVVGLGVATDAIAYRLNVQNIIIPVLPYRLQSLGYSNISTLTSWLLFAYSGGILVCIFPTAHYFARYPYRRGPLVVAVILLEASLIIFMLVQPYWVMVVSRFLQGAASAVVWSVGFALICENIPEKNIGRQTGFATAGMAIGMTMAAPIGGAMYYSLGWHAPFIFTIIICGVDLLMRLIVIEQKHLHKYDIDPSLFHFHSTPDERGSKEEGATSIVPDAVLQDRETSEVNEAGLPGKDIEGGRSPEAENNAFLAQGSKQHTPGWKVICLLATSKRGMTGFLGAFIFGSVMGAIDPTPFGTKSQTSPGWCGVRAAFIPRLLLTTLPNITVAAAAPTLVTGPIVGASADIWGAEWIMAPCLLLTLPWIPLMIMKSSLPGFMTYFAFAAIFISSAMGPVSLEITMAARNTPGLSEIHQFAAMNVSYSVSSLVGAVIGGQLYDHLDNGWEAVMWFCFAFVLAGVPPTIMWAGNKPLIYRLPLLRAFRNSPVGSDNQIHDTEPEGTEMTTRANTH